MAGPTFRVACVQVTAPRDLDAGIAAAADGVRAARERGADLIALPENAVAMEQGRANVFGIGRPEDAHPALDAFRGLARETGAWILVGSLTVTVSRDRVANRSYLIDAGGGIAAHYDKIHMFDVDLADGESYRESRTFRPGARAVVADTPFGRAGLTVCYDLRFPHLYRALAGAGARLLFVPSAFTRPTGAAHWHVLLRARAIETGCFVVAPAQCGAHPCGRKTYGHSLIVDPWGEVLADGGEDPGVVVADLDPARVDEARRMVPSLSHDRPFSGP